MIILILILLVGWGICVLFDRWCDHKEHMAGVNRKDENE